jgi:hypothetical protein
MTRVAVGGYLVAVNTFATQPSGLESFRRSTLSGDAVLRAGRRESAIAGFMQGARERNWEAVPLNFVLAHFETNDATTTRGTASESSMIRGDRR